MYVSALALSCFRSWEHAALSFEPGVIAFVGSNGQGKTNLIEGLGYLATLASHRVAADAPLIKAGCESATIQAHVVRDERTTLVEIDLVTGRTNKARINRTPVPRPREILGLVRTVLFAPEDLALVKGEPTDRRRFIDELMTLRTPRLAGVKADFERVVKQRNALLKSALATRRGGHVPDAALRTLEVWDGNLITLGAELLHGRLDLIHYLSPLVAVAYDNVSDGNGPAKISYNAHDQAVADIVVDGSVPDRMALEAALADALTARRKEELDRGITLVGPHRDDLKITLGEFPAKGFASHGESWSLALALRLASFELLKLDEEPVLILDDVFAELDTKRRARLAEVVQNTTQTFITAAVAQDVPSGLHNEQRFNVIKGQVAKA